MADTADRELVITRLFDAPRELVFAVWNDKEKISLWWGPRGFTTTTYHVDVRPGGTWRYIMHGPDGVDYNNLITYIEVVEPERLVYRHGTWEENDPGEFHVTATFTEEGEQTRVTLRMLLPTAEQRNMVIEMGAIEGGNDTMARLAEYLQGMG